MSNLRSFCAFLLVRHCCLSTRHDWIPTLSDLRPTLPLGLPCDFDSDIIQELRSVVLNILGAYKRQWFVLHSDLLV
jgi:hypothetical protein